MRLFTIIVIIPSLIQLSTDSFAQGGKKRRGEPAKLISDADRTAIVEIFKTLEAGDYYMEFAVPKPAVVYGSKKVDWTDLQLLKDNHPTLPSLWHAYRYLPEIGLTFLIKIGAKSQLKLTLPEIFGSGNAARLEAVINKYTGGQ